MISKSLAIVLHENEIDVYRNHEYIETKQIKSSFEKRLAVVQLVNNYNAMKNPHRFKGNKSRELEQNRLEAKQHEQLKVIQKREFGRVTGMLK